MKKTLLLALATLFASATFAQQQLATLNHNDSISVYYGSNALASAHAAAMNGDIITLSSGTFNSVEITKAISIKGNGMEADTIAGTTPTVISGPFSINIPSGILENFSMQGVKITGYTTCYNAVSPSFNKCRFELFQTDYYGQTTMSNAVFTNCVLNRVEEFNTWGNSFINCIILLSNSNGWPRSSTYRNCIVYIKPELLGYSHNDYADVTCINSILMHGGSEWNYVTGVTPIACYNCIGICYNHCSGGYFLSLENNNRNYSGISSVFKYFTGWYSDGSSLELQDSIAANILGNDGTQIGVYGGMVPFNPRVNTPRYVNCSVAPHTTLDGKLSVDIEVVSE